MSSSNSPSDDYIHNYYNPNQTHQGLDGQTPIPTPTHITAKVEDVKLKSNSCDGRTLPYLQTDCLISIS